MSSTRDKTVLVTGASSGIGLATAKRLAGRGHRVVAAARRKDRLAALAVEFADRIHALELDVRDHAAVSAAVVGLPAEFANIDVLVNNAGLGQGSGPVQEGRIEDWMEMVDTNVKGLLNVLHAVLPGMAARKRGHILNMSSIAATQAYPGSNVYGGTKGFVHVLSKNLRTDLAGTGIRVTDIQPGAVATEFARVRLGGDDARANSVYQGYRPLTGEDIAAVVEFVIGVPDHVNISSIEVMPTDQAAAGFIMGGPTQ